MNLIDLWQLGDERTLMTVKKTSTQSDFDSVPAKFAPMRATNIY